MWRNGQKFNNDAFVLEVVLVDSLSQEWVQRQNLKTLYTYERKTGKILNGQLTIVRTKLTNTNSVLHVTEEHIWRLLIRSGLLFHIYAHFDKALSAMNV